VRPLPRLLAFTDAGIRTSPRFGAAAAAIASLGPPVALVARDHQATGADLTGFAAALLAHARPSQAALIVAGRPDIAAALGASGVHLRADDLSVADARSVLRTGWIGRSVHSVYEAGRALEEGAQYLVAGPVFQTASHPGRPPAGLSLIEEIVQLGRPVFAIGGITPERAREAREAGAWGVAAISALWSARRPAEVVQALLEPWAA